MATVHLNEKNFEAEVKKADLPVIVDFWAEWCGPCKLMGPVFEELSDEYKGKMKFGKLNVDENQNLAEEFEVRSIPTLAVFKGGKVVGTIVGYYPKHALKEQIGKHLN